MKKKNPISEMTNLGLNMSVGHLALSSFPANDITPKVSAGYTKVASAFPAMGTMIGTGMLIQHGKKLIKTSKKLKF